MKKFLIILAVLFVGSFLFAEGSIKEVSEYIDTLYPTENKAVSDFDIDCEVYVFLDSNSNQVVVDYDQPEAGLRRIIIIKFKSFEEALDKWEELEDNYIEMPVTPDLFNKLKQDLVPKRTKVLSGDYERQTYRIYIN